MSETNENPYQTPESDIRQKPEHEIDEKTFKRLAGGQKMAIYAIALYFVAAALVGSIGPVAASWIIIVALIVALIGLIRILIGSHIGTATKILLFIGMFIPLVNLLALARVSGIATKELRSYGYEVGFLGVKGGYKG